jgi:hypothetical protein
LLFIFAAIMKQQFDFVADEESRKAVQNVGFGIGILFASMAVVIGLLGILAAVCNRKGCTVCVSDIMDLNHFSTQSGFHSSH